MHSIFPYSAILSIASWLVPGTQRAEWLAEWKSELWYALRRSDTDVDMASRMRSGAIAFCLGAFSDARWLKRHHRSNSPRVWLECPLTALLILVVLAAVNAFAVRLFGRQQAIVFSRNPLEHLLMIVLALGIVPATAPLFLGGVPANRHARAWPMAVGRWVFFAIKIALLLVIVFCGSINFLAPLTSGQIQPHGLLVGYVLAFRWAIIDQRKRCPVCLRLVTCPTQIGQSSRTFLEWCGTEYLCVRGHGMLYVPEFQTSCYDAQRWMQLDPSWRAVFSSRRE
jgi:hypothetical protein